ncbi:MAG TPA: hypothetical protein VFT95_16790 [Micromonosporaceae bacterium]|nr:hypothetical protein [Micromonosporaceae bacterium]
MAAPTFSTGDVPTATQVNTWFVNVLFARKTGDTSRSSTTTFTDDPHLTVEVEANAVYLVHCNLAYHSTSQTAGDFKAQFTAPASAAFQGSAHTYAAASAAATDDVSAALTLTTTVNCGVVATADPFNPCMISGVLVTSGTSGSFTVQWAQSASSGTATVLKTNSFLALYRLS